MLGLSFPWCAAWSAELVQLFAAYVEAKQRQNVLDYDDLLLYWPAVPAYVIIQITEHPAYHTADEQIEVVAELTQTSADGLGITSGMIKPL